MRIFLTGGTGYIGRVLAWRLAALGHEVRALVRPTSNLEALRRPGLPETSQPTPDITPFLGDITDRASMREAMAGSDWVIHAAADLDLTGPPGRMRMINVEGSENVASLAYKLGVGRFLSVSSMAYFGGSPPDGSPADETCRPQTPFPTAYSETKHLGEKAIQEWARKGLKVNTVYPSLVYGPPGKKEGSNALLRGIVKGRFPFLMEADRKTSWIFIDDVVDGILKVMEKAPPGRDYLLTGDVATLRQVVEQVCALAGTRPPRGNLSAGMARALLTLATPFYRLRGRKPPVPIEQLRSVERHWAFDDSRARRELDWHPRTLAAGLPPTVELLKAS